MMQLLLVFGLLQGGLADCSFKGVAELRSEGVKTGFRPALVQGRWYEQIYHDVAQGAATCQRLDIQATETGGLESNFSVIYSGGPFTIAEHYTPEDGTGVFRKYVSIPGGIPGGSLIGMPTAVVDVVPGASGTGFDALILYSCYTELMKVIEIATREPVVDESVIEDLYQRAAERVPFIARQDMHRVDQTKCSHSNMTSKSLFIVL
mmetsp:Transcript_24015/g.45318  ORF Transcript_24015/g.45318 Transcript_24015/m.45318 type:complete len:206 (+) Transcript_24015:92-709(+)